jgi:hypothetical protein
MQRDRKPQAMAKPPEEPRETVLRGPMFVTDARGRTFYLSLTALALDACSSIEPLDEPGDDDIDGEVVRWRI